MEAIRNYLETMFGNLPNTPEVLRAKDELLQMMEDKYTELKEQGKSENEAVGTVISEFGNLEELAEGLGIKNAMNTEQTAQGRILNGNEVKSYLEMCSKHAYRVALGVLLCILCPIPTIFLEAIGTAGRTAVIFEAIGTCLLFLMVGIAVGIFIYTGTKHSSFDYIKTQPLRLDFATSKYVHEQHNQSKAACTVEFTIGVVLCVICVIPAVILDGIHEVSKFTTINISDASGALVLLFVGVGVFLIVHSKLRFSGYTTLLSLNRRDSVGANYTTSQQNNKGYVKPGEETWLDIIAQCYWPTITCIYFMWSFVSFDWHITWIIWPLAAIGSALLGFIRE